MNCVLFAEMYQVRKTLRNTGNALDMSGNFVSAEKWGKHVIHSQKTIDFNAKFVCIFNTKVDTTQ